MITCSTAYVQKTIEHSFVVYEVNQDQATLWPLLPHCHTVAAAQRACLHTASIYASLSELFSSGSNKYHKATAAITI